MYPVIKNQYSTNVYMMFKYLSMMVESSEYPVRPGIKDCQFYLRTGRCGYGENCCYNHPKEIPTGKINMPKCKFFLRGKCKNGSHCDFDHSKEGDRAEHTRQGQKRYRTESTSRSSPEKRKHRQGDIEKQSTEAEDIPQGEKLREMQENDNDQQKLVEQRKRDIERQRREARLSLEQIKPTVYFDEAIRIREILAEFGFIHTEGDGL
ncbi:zinc finger CCCH domain-containing protein 3-like isoform X1 [Brassica rapa]|uniref:zinc finger CCCH domain-containing protein 3-like isoform X1 n=2 Tax=Brassica campestris TaxID=3711 RepID=UPI00142D25BA|nr:zinc finger CCCH domain-containing protein 3-like isoform X1 [Brassica rapa]